MATPPRVLSLLSASTEIVHRLGCGHLLVGRSHGCDDPPLAKTLPVATAPRVDPNARSDVIDESVRAQSVAGGPIYHIHSDFVREAQPDIIITQQQCRICAVTPDDVAAACSGSTATMVTIMPVTLEDVLQDVATIARVLGVPQRGERLVRHLQARMAQVTAAVDGAFAPSQVSAAANGAVEPSQVSAAASGGVTKVAPAADTHTAPSVTEPASVKAPPSTTAPASVKAPPSMTAASCVKAAASVKAAHVEWLAPLMGSGYWIAQCFAAARCEMVHGTAGGHSPTLTSWTQLDEAELLILAPCGFSIERTYSELLSLKTLQRPEWLSLPAVTNGRVYVADGNLYFNRSSCGVLETAEMVAEMAWPELVGMWGHHGKHWVRLDELAAFCAREGAAPATKPVQLAPGTLAAAANGAANGAADGAANGAADGAANGHANGAAHQQATQRAGSEEATPTAHVQQQVDDLRAADFAAAFALNSAANRARIGDAAKFESIVRGNSSFAALADVRRPCVITPVIAAARDADSDGKHTVEVRVQTECDGEITFAFDLSAAEAGRGYATDGVRIVC